VFTFKPIKLGKIFQECTLFFDNQDYTDPIPIIIKGECVDVPIYVEKLAYNLHTVVYEKTFREKIMEKVKSGVTRLRSAVAQNNK